MAGTLTDTGYFSHNGCSLPALRMFKHLIGAYGHSDLHAVEASLRYDLPQAAQGLLATPPVITGALSSPDGAALRAQVERLLATGAAVTSTAKRAGGCAITTCPKALLDAAVAAAQLEDPAAACTDIVGALKDRLHHESRSHELAVLITENADEISVSFRCQKGDLALRLAQQFDGGGHERAAGAHLHGMTLADAEATIRTAAEHELLAQEARLRGGRH
jgi:hypothetical protein